MGVAATISAVAAVASVGVSAYSAFSDDGGGGSATAENQVNPASWSALGYGGQDLWNSFASKWLGGMNESIAQAKEKLTPKQLEELNSLDNSYKKIQDEMQKHHTEWLRQGRSEEAWNEHSNVKMWNGWLDKIDKERKEKYPEIYGDGALEPTPGMEDRMEQDSNFRRDASLKRLSDVGAITKTLQDDSGRLTGDYGEEITRRQSDFDKALSSPIRGLLSANGQPLGFLSRGMQNVARSKFDTGTGTARNLYETGLTDAALRATTGENMANMQFDHSNTFTPNAAYMSYMDKLWPMVSQLQGFRFQTPSTTQTATGTYEPTLADKVGGVTSFLQALADLFKKNTTNVPTQTTQLTPQNYYQQAFVDQGLFEGY